MLRRRIPGERPSELHGNPADDAGAAAAMRDRGRGKRLLTGPHAFEPVLVMVIAARQSNAEPFFGPVVADRSLQAAARPPGVDGSLEVVCPERVTQIQPSSPKNFSPFGACRKHSRGRFRGCELDVIGTVHIPDLVGRETPLCPRHVVGPLNSVFNAQCRMS